MFWLHRLNPANKFKEHFELAQALTPELKDEVYRLRHRVYVDELGFERPTLDGRERDEFDEQSKHLLMRSVKTGIVAGCIRLVMVRPDRPMLPLPFEKIFAATSEVREFQSGGSRLSIAEISRLALAREYRRHRRVERRGEVAHEGFGTPAHPSFPYVQLGLYLGAIALARQLEVTKLFLLTEPRLLVHFRRMGFPVRKIGGPVEHRGLRVLSTADVVNPEEQLPFFMRPLYKVIELELAEDLRPAPRRPELIPVPDHLTGQIGPGSAGAHPSLRQRILAYTARAPRHGNHSATSEARGGL
jgi:N-acyl amino acid synthase of PEP-CTERM/exosortase system